MILINFIITLLLLQQFHYASSFPKKIMCETINLKSYDCSNRGLGRRGLEESLIEPTLSADSINLSFNNFDQTISNYTFNSFKLLHGILNLTGNKLDKIESHAFFFNPYTIQSIKQIEDMKPMKIRMLDLSANDFSVVPWNSIKFLPDLKELYLNDNKKLIKLNSDGLSDSVSKIFQSLTHIYMTNCGIEYVEPKTVENFQKLEFLDLSSNKLHNLNQNIRHVFIQIMQSTKKSLAIKLKNNPLFCDCNLLWLKDFLIQNGHDEPTCTLDRSIGHDLPKHSLMRTVAVDLVNNPNKKISADQLDLTSPDPSFIEDAVKAKLPLTSLDDSMFVCEIELIEPIEPAKWFQVTEHDDRYEIALTCVAQGYPRPAIRWNENNKSLDKKSEYKTWKIEERDRNGTLPMLLTVESTLIFFLELPIRPSLYGYRNYSCKAMLNTETKMKILHSSDEINSVDLVQKAIDFKVYHGVDLTVRNWFTLDSPVTDSSHDGVLYRKEHKSSYEKLRERPLIYWIILFACILLVLVVVLFSTYCIVHNNHRSAKMREELAFLGQSTYSVNKRSIVYLTNPKTSKARNSLGGMGTVDKSILVPLKPDNIRDHQEYCSIYNNNQNNRTVSQDESVHYSNMNFGSPSSLLMGSPIKMMHEHGEGNHSFDDKPTQSSPIDSSNESDDGLKSCDENIVDYQDPELINLRRPGQKNMKA